MAITQKIKFQNFTWLNIINPEKQEIESLAKNYSFHPLDLADCLSPSQRVKCDVYSKYAFFVFLFPVYNRQTREISPGELDIFIGKNFIITLHREELTVFNDFFNFLHQNPAQQENYPDKSPERLFYEILNKLFLYCFPMIDHLSLDCENIAKAIFSGKEKKMVSEILVIRRNITDFRKIMQVHRHVLKKGIYFFKNNAQFVMKKTDVYFESLVDFSKEVWDTLENLKERIEALQQTNESQISFKLSDIMKTLTILSVLTFPLTLTAAIFAMQPDQTMPFIHAKYGFWYIILIMLGIAVAMLAFFKKKDWL